MVGHAFDHGGRFVAPPAGAGLGPRRAVDMGAQDFGFQHPRHIGDRRALTGRQNPKHGAKPEKTCDHAARRSVADFGQDSLNFRPAEPACALERKAVTLRCKEGVPAKR